MADPIVVTIQPTAEFVYAPNQFYDVYYAFPEVLLVSSTQTPYISAAQTLLGLGYDATRKLFMRRRGVSINQLNYTIGNAAELGVEYEQQPPPQGRAGFVT